MTYADPARQREYQRQWIARRRAAWFEGRACIDCGSTQELELDHVDPVSKVHHTVWSWSADRREQELAKCVARCASCHRVKSGSEHAKGSDNGLAKLDNEKVWDIRRRAARGETRKSIADLYRVDRSTVGYIVRRDDWRHI